MRTIDRRFCIALIAALCLVTALPGLSASEPKQRDSKTSTHQTAQRDAGPATTGEGEQKFKQNCSRCHGAPQELSTRTSGTVLRHMRVRASLSERDERDILKFLNP